MIEYQYEPYDVIQLLHINSNKIDILLQLGLKILHRTHRCRNFLKLFIAAHILNNSIELLRLYMI